MFRSFDELLDAARARGPAFHRGSRRPRSRCDRGAQARPRIGLWRRASWWAREDEIRALARAGGFELPDSQIVNEPDPAAAVRQAIALVREGRAGLLMKGKIAPPA
jgi:hypothetical protein